MTPPDPRPAAEAERQRFEAWVSAPPFEYDAERYDLRYSWPDNYVEVAVQLAWEAWKERGAEVASRNEAYEIMRNLKNHTADELREVRAAVAGLVAAVRKFRELCVCPEWPESVQAAYDAASGELDTLLAAVAGPGE